MKKLSRNQLRRLIEQQYKGVPVKFDPDHKRQMGQRMRSNSEMMDLLKKGDMGFGEKGMRYDPVMGDEGRPVGVSQRDRTGQEMQSIRDTAAAERAAYEAEMRQRQQSRDAETARLSSLSLEELTDERKAFMSTLVQAKSDTRYPYGVSRGDVETVSMYRKRDDAEFTDEELQSLKDYDTLEARQHGAYAALAGTTSSSLSPDKRTLQIRYKRHTSG
tara:strand:+ start:2924 stop:3574 length:651 start_codon:yes stop_codon:yes gene_type:complete